MLRGQRPCGRGDIKLWISHVTSTITSSEGHLTLRSEPREKNNKNNNDNNNNNNNNNSNNSNILKLHMVFICKQKNSQLFIHS